MKTELSHFRSVSVLMAIVAFMLSAAGASAQTAVRGKVVSDKGEPVIGAAVIVQNTSVGTVTDIDGRFSIDLPDGGETLVVSCLGFADAVVPVGGEQTLRSY